MKDKVDPLTLFFLLLFSSSSFVRQDQFPQLHRFHLPTLQNEMTKVSLSKLDTTIIFILTK